LKAYRHKRRFLGFAELVYLTGVEEGDIVLPLPTWCADYYKERVPGRAGVEHRKSNQIHKNTTSNWWTLLIFD
jgi:hypothetical protein